MLQSKITKDKIFETLEGFKLKAKDPSFQSDASLSDLINSLIECVKDSGNYTRDMVLSHLVKIYNVGSYFLPKDIDVTSTLTSLLTKKNDDYDNAFEVAYNDIGFIAIAVPLYHKLVKFKLTKETKPYIATDTLLDILGYTVLSYILVSQKV